MPLHHGGIEHCKGFDMVQMVLDKKNRAYSVKHCQIYSVRRDPKGFVHMGLYIARLT